MPQNEISAQESMIKAWAESAAEFEIMEQSLEGVKAVPNAESIVRDAEDPNVLAQMRRSLSKASENLKNRLEKTKTDKKGDKENPFEKQAKEFANKNKGHRPNILAQLRQDIEDEEKTNRQNYPTIFRDDKAKDRILAIVSRYYPDEKLGSEAFDFLIETSQNDPALLESVKKAKAAYIEYGQKITHAASAAAQKYADDSGVRGKTFSPSHFNDLKSLFREVAFGEHDVPTLFDKLSKIYSYKDLFAISTYIFHELGVENKKNPEAPMLRSLLRQTRNLQAILNVFRLFQGWKSVDKRLDKLGAKPPEYTFEALAKAFIHLAVERNPSHDKILKIPESLNIQATDAKIIIVNALRDAVRMVSPNIFKSDRQELRKIIVEVSEELEDQSAIEHEKLEAEEEIRVEDPVPFNKFGNASNF